MGRGAGGLYADYGWNLFHSVLPFWFYHEDTKNTKGEIIKDLNYLLFLYFFFVSFVSFVVQNQIRIAAPRCFDYFPVIY